MPNEFMVAPLSGSIALVPLRQPPGNGLAVIAWRQFPDEQHQ